MQRHERREEDRYRGERGSSQRRRGERFEGEGGFGSPHDQGLHTGPREWRERSEHERGYERSDEPGYGRRPGMQREFYPRERGYEPSRQYYGGFDAYDEPYAPDDFYRGSRRGPGYRETYPYGSEWEVRGEHEARPYREENEYGQRRFREREQWGSQKGSGGYESEFRQGRSGYRGEEQTYRSQGQGHPGYQQGSYPEERSYSRREERPYPRSERMRSEERRGLEEYYGGREEFSHRGEPGYRQGGSWEEGRETRRPQREFEGRESRRGYPSEYREDFERRSSPERGPERERFEGESRSRGSREELERGQRRRPRDEREQYNEWLEEHRNDPPETEGERQLEGLQPQHESHRSDHRHEQGTNGRQPRSQRRFDENELEEQEGAGRSSKRRTAMKSVAGESKKSSSKAKQK